MFRVGVVHQTLFLLYTFQSVHILELLVISNNLLFLSKGQKPFLISIINDTIKTIIKILITNKLD